MSRTFAAAALPSVIGGPGFDFIFGAEPVPQLQSADCSEPRPGSIPIFLQKVIQPHGQACSRPNRQHHLPRTTRETGPGSDRDAQASLVNEEARRFVGEKLGRQEVVDRRG